MERERNSHDNPPSRGSSTQTKSWWADWHNWLALFIVVGFPSLYSVPEHLPHYFPAFIGTAIAVFLLVGARRNQKERERRIRAEVEAEFTAKVRPSVARDTKPRHLRGLGE